MTGRRRKKQIWRVVSDGGVTHNGASDVGALVITIWGHLAHDPARQIAVDIGEDDARRLVRDLTVRFGITA